jgi:hypothetical protein
MSSGASFVSVVEAGAEPDELFVAGAPLVDLDELFVGPLSVATLRSKFFFFSSFHCAFVSASLCAPLYQHEVAGTAAHWDANADLCYERMS